MTDFIEHASKRQSCRDFSDKPVEREKLVKCLEAARLTPSGCNSQPWRVLVVTDPAVLPEVAKTTQQLGLNEYTSKAQAFFVVLETYAKLMPKIASMFDSQVFAKGDLGAFTYALTLEAEAQGLGTVILGMFDRPKLIELLKIPAGESIFLVVAVGYPAKEGARPKARKSLEEIHAFI
ncbi:MAG: nitroreductase family protein [Deltaproteobacteria bacterium]|jgi:nitroreductase|nr:nitroreductase family protein [Deltaproteobacteria bacterium]